jgi:Recombinase zinc beta ribbon domain
LSSPSLGGFVPSGGELRRDAKNILIRIDPLISAEDYGRLQEALKTRANARRSDASSLLGVARCLLCSAPYYITTYKDRRSSDKHFRYYQCRNAREGRCPAGRIPEAQLVELVTRRFLNVVGRQGVLEPAHIAAVDHSERLTEIAEAMDDLEAKFRDGKLYRGAAGRERFARLMSSLEDEQEQLLAIGVMPARTEYHETGRTFLECWEASDEGARRHLMRDSGFRFYYARMARSPAEIQADARKLGITQTAAQLRRRAANLNFIKSKMTDPAKLAARAADLATVERQRQRLRDIPRYRDAQAAPVGAELARRAGLAASGQLVELPDDDVTWEKVLAPARAALLRPRQVS